jgi:dienelactone hydrolase
LTPAAGCDLFAKVGAEMNAARRFAWRRFALAALAGLAAALPCATRAEQRVTFAPVEPRAGDTGEISGYASRPLGAGPFPAVVLLHSCLGLPKNRRAIADMIAGWGYVALFVDDFTTRGLRETCAVDFGEGIADAFGALAFLAKLPYVDPKRVAVVGYSQGADTALAIAALPLAASGDLRFKAAAAFYPPCANEAGAQLQTPTLILVGGLDEVTPAADCERLAQAQPGSDVSLVVYAKAAHGFDNPEFAGGKRVLGMELKYDRDAAEQSKLALRDFLATGLAR